MLLIEAKDISKKFNQHPIIQQFSHTFQSGNQYGIIGNNGSGKSTLLKILAGYITPNSGSIAYHLNQQNIPADDVYKHLSFAAPYLDVIDDFTIEEQVHFHFTFKKCLLSQTTDIFDIMQLPKEKKIRDFSSGMRQKLKLTLSVLSAGELLLIDEPGSFLDTFAKDYFHQLLEKYGNKRLIMIASNEKNDLVGCTEIINIEHYKRSKA